MATKTTIKYSELKFLIKEEINQTLFEDMAIQGDNKRELTTIKEPKRSGLDISQLDLSQNGGIKNILAVYNQATPEEKEYWGKWYHNAKKDVENLAGQYNLPFPVMAAIVAVLSPGNKWQNNLLAADKLLRGDTKINAYPRQIVRAKDILSTGNIGLVTGPKVTVFFKSLISPSEVEKDMVLDGHAINIWRGSKVSLKGLKSPGFKDQAAMVQDYKKAAEFLKIPVQSLQAITWYIWKYTSNTQGKVIDKVYDLTQFKKTSLEQISEEGWEEIEQLEDLAEFNAIGFGAVMGWNVPLGMDMRDSHKLMWSGDDKKEKNHPKLKNENVLDQQGHQHVGGSKARMPFSDTYVDKSDTGKQKSMVKQVNKNLNKKSYSLDSEPPTMGISIGKTKK